MKIVVVFIIWNMIVFALYGLDKYRAIKKEWRISEKVLLMSALFMGALGALLGMQACRHKTKHKKFQILVPLFLVLQIVIVVFMINYQRVF